MTPFAGTSWTESNCGPCVESPALAAALRWCSTATTITGSLLTLLAVKIYGHRRAKIMNGGRQKWVNEGSPMTTEVPKPGRRTYRVGDPDPSVRALRDYVLGVASTRNNVGLVDVRAPAEYSGELLAPANLPQEGSQREATFRARATFRGPPRSTRTTGPSSPWRAAADIRRPGYYPRHGDHHLLPHRRAFIAYLVCAHPDPRLQQGTQLRRFLDRVRQHRGRAHRALVSGLLARRGLASVRVH